MPKGISIEQFCSRNKVPYNIFYKWYKDTRNKIVEVKVYIKDDSYPIDNNVAERAVRPLTPQRNSMLRFGCDEGAKMAATYHSIISTVKLQGRSAWDYLGKFLVNIFNGCRDFFSLRPGNIGLATCQ